MIRIELNTTDPFEVKLASAYWAFNESGFVFELDEVLKDFGIANKRLLVSLVQKYSEAWIEGSACPICRRLQRVKARSEYLEKSSLAKSRPICSDCKSKGLRRPVLQERKADSSTPSPKFNYQFSTDAQKLILFALSRVNEEGFINGLLEDSDLAEVTLAPNSALARMIETNGQVIKSMSPRGAQYLIATARGLSSTQQTLERYVTQTPLSGDGSVYELWRQYGAAESLRYLSNLLNRASLANLFTSQLCNGIHSDILDGLAIGSLSFIWYRLWIAIEKVRKDPDNQTPEKIVRLIQNSLAASPTKDAARAPWKRVLPLSALGVIFLNYLGVDDSTPPDQVRLLSKKTSSLTKHEDVASLDIEAYSKTLLQQAIESASCSKFLEAIAASLGTPMFAEEIHQRIKNEGYWGER